METKKRERSVNFIPAEVQLLHNLAEKYQHIIGNKKTDAVTNKNKEIAWKRIESSFNLCGLTPNIRTWKTLKQKYDGIKKNDKKKSKQIHEESEITGESSNVPDFDNIDEKVLRLSSNIHSLGPHNFDPLTTQTTDEDPILSLKLEQQRLKMQYLKRQQEFKEEEHNLKMRHLENDERRREEIHALVVQRLKNDILK